MIEAMSDVVRRGGFGTSVTPVSQFYFQQAFNNVMFGPWEKIAEPYGKMVLGYFGKTPVPPDPEIVELASEQLGLEPTTRPPLELNDDDPNKGIGAGPQAQLQEAGSAGDRREPVHRRHLQGKGPRVSRRARPSWASARSTPTPPRRQGRWGTRASTSCASTARSTSW